MQGGSSFNYGAWFYFPYWTDTKVCLDFHMEKILQIHEDRDNWNWKPSWEQNVLIP